MPRPGRQGYRPKKLYSTRNTAGRISPNLQAWAQIGTNHYQLYLFDENFQQEGPDGPQLITDELGPTVRLTIVRKFATDLTNMTEEELIAMREFFNRAFALAEPIVLARDKEAKDVYDSGDDTFARLHRTVPSVVVRSWAERAHSEVLRFGPAAIVAGGWDFLNRLLGSGRSGEQVADGEPSNPLPQDDGPTPD